MSASQEQHDRRVHVALLARMAEYQGRLGVQEQAAQDRVAELLRDRDLRSVAAEMSEALIGAAVQILSALTANRAAEAADGAAALAVESARPRIADARRRMAEAELIGVLLLALRDIEGGA